MASKANPALPHLSAHSYNTQLHQKTLGMDLPQIPKK